jgi:hypothetical protein
MQPKPKRRPPTSEEALARQAAEHAPRPLPSKKPAAASPGNGGTAVVPAKPTGNLPAAPDTRTNVQRYLDEIAPSGIVGRMVKFSKEGKHTITDTQEEVSPETDFIAICDQTCAGHIKFNEEGEPPERIMGLIYEGFTVTETGNLPARDPADWPQGLSGAPEDPWRHTIYLVLQHADTKELFTFVTQSQTGRRSVGNLLRHYDRMRKSHPGELPVVRLKTGGFQSRDERIGWVNVPVFVVVGRTPADGATRPDTSLQSQLDDEIPFS